jgi:type IV pilus assembly protein PilA
MRNPDTKGFTLVELLMVVALIGVIIAIAVPRLLNARMSANEASAISSLRAINSAQMAYSVTCGRGFFAATLLVLGTAPPLSGPAFISPDLGRATTITKSGYTITMGGGSGPPAGTPASCNAGAMRTGYYARAARLSTNTGTRFFFTNTSSAIYQKSSAFTATNVAGKPTDAGALPIR